MGAGLLGTRRGRLTASLAAACLVSTTLGALISATPAAAAPTDITTIAGGGSDGLGDGGPPTAATLAGPTGIKRVGGRLYVSEQGRNRVRKIQNNVITSFVGGGTAPLGDGLKATEATFNGPQGVAFDAAGNMYVADSVNNRIRRVDAVTRVITTVAGTGAAGFSGDGGPATSAQLDGPIRVAVDAGGNLFISDVNNKRIRRVDAVTRVITTVAGNGTSASSGDGGPATAAGFDPRGVAIDSAGNLYIADVSTATIRKVTAGPDGVVNGGPGELITTYVGGGTLLLDPANEGQPALQFSLLDSQAFPEGIAFDSADNLYVSLVGSPRVVRVAAPGNHPLATVAGNGIQAPPAFSGDGGPATKAELLFPFGVTVDPAGNVYIADVSAQRVRRVDTVTHVITTIAGQGQVGTSAPFGSYGDGGLGSAVPIREAADVAFSGGSVFFVDRGLNRIRRIDANGIITTYAGGGVNDGPGLSAVLDHPRGLDADAAGNLYIADCGNGRVRKVTPAGVTSTVAGGGDHLDVGKATDVALGCPSDVAVVKSGPDAGTIYIADTADNKIRKVTPAGDISTVAGTGTPGFAGDGGSAIAAQLNGPQGVNLAPNGDLLVADTANNRVRRVEHTTGIITTIAGDGAFGQGADGVPATSTTVSGPTDVIADGAGNLYIAEAAFNRIREVDAAGIITTVAGNGIPGFGGDGGPPRDATLSAPTQLELADNGALLFTDRGNGRVRRIGPGTPPPPRTKGCGALLTKDTTLTADLGPCPANGLVVGADNITVNLNGHTVSGAGAGDGSHAGILITNHTGVTVTGGPGSTVTGFDDGVAIVGGSANTVKSLTIRDNVGPPTTDAVFGDGIGIFFSAGNTVVNNTVAHNGIYTGIAILGPGSNDNTIKANVVSDTVDVGEASTSNGSGIVINAFLSTDFPRMASVFRNKVVANVVETSDNSGISNISNVNGVITDNTVRNNGRRVDEFPRNGIGVQHLDFAQVDTHVLLANNVVTGNQGGDAMHIASDQNIVRNNQVTANQTSNALMVTANRNTVHNNQVAGNQGAGIPVAGDQNLVSDNQVHGNYAGIVVTGQVNRIVTNNAADNVPPAGDFVGSDLDDENFSFVIFDFDCDHNTWIGNIWGSGGFFPDCTTVGGHPAPGGPPPPSAGVPAARPARPAPPPSSSAKAPSVDDTFKRGFPARP